MLTTILSMIRYISDTDDRDFVDRLHSIITTNLLIAFSVLVSFKQFGGTPIECLTPDVFSGSWEDYAENFCWAQDTYMVLMHEMLDGMPQKEREERRISYYQWVPFFLLIQAACFRLPSILWKYLSGHSGIKIQEIVKLSSDPNNIKPDIKKGNIKSLTVHLQGALRFHRRLNKKQIKPHRMMRLFNLPYSACFVTVMYMLTKFSYLANVFMQLLLLNKFLETDRYNYYGLGAIMDMLNGKTWETSGVFPRVSLCDFQVRVMGNIQEHTIQCVLVINIFNEKIFVFLWFWFVFLLFFTMGSFIYWITIFLLPYPNRRFIKRHLEMSELPYDPDTEDWDVQRFIDSYLRSDGIFVIRMLTLHSGVIFGTDLVQELWKSYFGIEERLHRSNSLPKLGFPMAVEDQTDYENAKNSLRLRKRGQLKELGSEGKKFDEAKERLVTPPLPPSSVLRAIHGKIPSPTKNQLGSESSTPGTRPASATDSEAGGTHYEQPNFTIDTNAETMPIENNNVLSGRTDSEQSIPHKLTESIPEAEEPPNDAANVSGAHDFRDYRSSEGRSALPPPAPRTHSTIVQMAGNKSS